MRLSIFVAACSGALNASSAVSAAITGREQSAFMVRPPFINRHYFFIIIFFAALF
jgi:hypothetical protein